MSSPKFSSNVNDIVELANYLMIKTDNLLLFVNGYRENLVDDINMNEDYENSDNLIRYVDDFPNSGSYWQERGEKFMLKIGTQNVVYADGHHKIYTSNHWVDDNLNKIQDDEDIRASKLKFATGMKGSLCAGNFAIPAAIGVITQGLVTGCVSCYHEPSCVTLDFPPNVDGYNKRYAAGKIGGKQLWDDIKSNKVGLKLDANGGITGKIDIVAHSMGYAYAQGMIDYLKQYLSSGSKFGRFYILMPENACSATTFDKTLFEEVWQYGSDEGLKNSVPWELDGVAPQCAVPGLKFGVLVGDKYGRIPNTNAPASKRNFTDAHTYFDWIFDLTKEGRVTKR